MPVTKTTKRRPGQIERRTVVNSKRILQMRKLIKEANSLLSNNNLAEVEKMLPAIYKAIDKAAKRGVIKKNAASRRKSRMAKKVEKLKK
ncbi:MAG: 30S ribosomal protein S20 [Candidatus Pacebacteria bacterium]|nr:30S ribosomal protein S20 [Candidatus Paceibacterota bacterium]